ncbi:MAG: hypothetical protein J6I80_03945 [Clostridia bacterium]|nr:hypothetical protein [Clostridia bacterium]
MENNCGCKLHEYFKRNIGRKMKIECYLNNRYHIIYGVLFEVGDNYIVLKKKQPLSTIMCDVSSIVIATVIY